MKRSKFSLSYTHLLSFDMGFLVPIGMTEVLPGDSIQHATSMLLRTAPLLAPVMHPVRISVHHWFVPWRLVWEDWEDFITGGPDGMDNSEFPTFTTDPDDPAWQGGALSDYLGVPPNSVEHAEAQIVSALPFRAYTLIWNEFYRDQDLLPELAIDKGSGPDTGTNIDMQRAAWEKDYFTSARPFEQKGPSITIPLGTDAPVIGNNQGITVVGQTSGAYSNWQVKTGTPDFIQIPEGAGTWTDGEYLKFSTSPGQTGLKTDLSGASAITVTALREYLAMQRMQEARARYGSRYTEYLRYLGVRSSDARLQRPEYLGGGRQVIQFSEVLQTAEGEDPVGEMRGHGISAMRSNRYRRFFEEHGVIMSLCTVRPKTIYAQSLNRMWNRRVKEDFWQKELQHVGQQEVLNKEVYAYHNTPLGRFGWQDRYDEYRRSESRVSGEFRNVLDHWHFARTFASSPALNATFVSCDPTDDPFAASLTQKLYCMASHSMQARRLVARSAGSFIF